jgi:hypothetical protein
MTEHNLEGIETTETQVIFECSNCKQVAGFAREGYGEPHVELHNDVWILPENAGVYINPCFKTCVTCGQVLPEIEPELEPDPAAETE